MKKLLFTGLLGLGLLLPATFSASEKSTTSVTEYSNKNPKKKTKKAKKSRSSQSYSRNSSKGCTYNGRQLYVGKKGGCYYYSGNRKTYVDRAYCVGCN